MPSLPPGGAQPPSIDDLLLDPGAQDARRLDAPYQLIFHHAGVGMARLSLSGRIVEVNPRFAEILGRRQADLAGLHIQDVTHPDDVGAGHAHLESDASRNNNSSQTESGPS